ncbi:MAG: radical SAM protein [Elusimicrobiota bacterium]
MNKNRINHKASCADGRSRGLALKNVEINPGRLCNNKCIFCMSGEDRDLHEPWAELDRMKTEIEMRFKEGARSLGFLGGEPTAYPHIVSCIRFARDLGYIRIALCTNGVRLSNGGFLDECIDAGLTRATISVHSHIPAIEEFLVRVPGILDRKIKALSNLVERRNRGFLPDGISVNPVFCRTNAPHGENYVRFFMDIGIKDFRFNFIWPESQIKNDKNVVPQFKDIVPSILRLILRNEKKWGVSLSFGAVPYCVLPAFVQRQWPLLRKYFYEEGNDLPTDVSFLYADPKKGAQRFNWHRKGHDSYRAKVDACGACPLDAVCMGIYKSYLKLYGDAEFKGALVYKTDVPSSQA